MTNRKHGQCSRSHRTPTYFTWQGMNQRCRGKSYKYHGSKGITVCEKWLTFEGFLEDMGERPNGMTIDRLDNTKGYYKENCRWATPTEQNLHLPTRSDNTSGRKGVTWNKMGRKWQAQAWLKGVCYNLYYGSSYDDAVKAREVWEAQNVRA